MFFFNDTATTEIYTLSLHDALPILHDRTLGWQEPRLAQSSLDSSESSLRILASNSERCTGLPPVSPSTALSKRSEEHTSELQSQSNLVCRLLLEKKKDAPLTSAVYR